MANTWIAGGLGHVAPFRAVIARLWEKVTVPRKKVNEMITAIRVENVRRFEGPDWKFELPLLTVFCGTNSAGKSTLLKVPLLLRQSLGIGGGRVPSRGRLQFAGSQVDLGSFSCIVSHNDTKREMVIEFEFLDEMPEALMRQVAETEGSSDDTPISSTWCQYTLKSTFRFVARTAGGRPTMAASDEDSESQVEESAQGILKSAQFVMKVGEKSVLEWEVQSVSRKPNSDFPNTPYDLQMPSPYFRRTGGPRALRIEKVNRLPRRQIRFGASLRGLLPDTMIIKIRQDKKGAEEITEGEVPWVHWPLPPHIAQANRALRNALTRIHYVEPLRSPGKRYYVAPLDGAPRLDAAGEFLPYVLRDMKRHRVTVRNLLPGQDLADVPGAVPLMEALGAWLYYLRTGCAPENEDGREELVVATTRDVLVEFKLRSTGANSSHALADSGFGYSQVLPIIIRGLLTSPGSTLIVEQPELHLNPALQVRLAEFFVAMVRSGKQVILETHSEHIVNGIRVLVAEDQTEALAGQCRIYFLDAMTGPPTKHDLSIQPDGTVPDWPMHFFGEATTLTARLLAAQRRFRKPTSSPRKP